MNNRSLRLIARHRRWYQQQQCPCHLCLVYWCLAVLERAMGSTYTYIIRSSLRGPRFMSISVGLLPLIARSVVWPKCCGETRSSARLSGFTGTVAKTSASPMTRENQHESSSNAGCCTRVGAAPNSLLLEESQLHSRQFRYHEWRLAEHIPPIPKYNIGNSLSTAVTINCYVET